MKLISLLLSFIFTATVSFGQKDLNTTLPVDPDVTIGTLSNGLTYYIRHNEKPDNKVELRLVVNAGSVLETDAQQGIAHLSEHMAFNGSKHFKKNDLISFLQSIGVAFGNDLNAYTGFDETVYILPIPTDNPENIEKGFQILQDWAANVTYADEDIDDERPIILEEARLRKGAADRMMKKTYPMLFVGSKYAERLPIGKEDVIKHASYATVKSFYKEWYRPDLMAVIVVGDISVDKAKSLINKYFAGLKNPKNEKKRVSIPVPPYTKDAAIVVTDPEATSYAFSVHYSALPKAPEKTLKDFKQMIIRNVFTNLLNQRLRELTQQSNPPFVYASANFGSFARGYEAFNATIISGSQPDISGLKAFEVALEQVKKYGFLPSELKRAKTQILNSMEQAYKEKDKTESSRYVSEYLGNFLHHEPIPGITNENAYYQQLVPAITLDEVNDIAKQLAQNKHEFVALQGPDPKEGVQLPTKDQLLSVQNEVAKMEIEPYQEKEITGSLIDNLPPAGKITAAVDNDLLGTTEFSLENGITVTLKHTDFKNDQVLMSAVREGGQSNFGLKDKYNAAYMIPSITSMGVGKFSPVDLNKFLSGKTVNVSPTFGDISSGMRGSSSVKDLETMFQLIHLYLTEPRKDTALFTSFVQKNKSQLAFLSSNPQVVFIDSLIKTVYHHSPLAPIAVPKAAYFDEINLDRMLQMYKDIFGNANGMHFTFVGSLDKETIKPLLEKYLANLPSKVEKFALTDNKLRPVEGRKDITVHLGKDPKALILRIYSKEVPFSQSLELKADAISEILNIRIIEELREKIKGIYGGGTQASLEKYPYQNFSLQLQLPCGPEKVDTLLKATHELVQDLIEHGPSQENLDKVKKKWIEDYHTHIKQNGSWLSNLQDFYFPGNDPHNFLQYEKRVNALTTEDIQEAAKLLLTTPNVVTGVLLPAKE